MGPENNLEDFLNQSQSIRKYATQLFVILPFLISTERQLPTKPEEAKASVILPPTMIHK